MILDGVQGDKQYVAYYLYCTRLQAVRAYYVYCTS